MSELTTGGAGCNEIIDFGMDQYQMSKKQAKKADDAGNAKKFKKAFWEMVAWEAYMCGPGGAISVEMAANPYDENGNAIGPVPENYEENRQMYNERVLSMFLHDAFPEPRPFGDNQPESVPGVPEYY